jgi:hypothetical protein
MNKTEILYTGIRLAPSGRYDALYNGKHLGTFDIKDEAAEVHHKYKEQKEQERLSKRQNDLPVGVRKLPSGSYQAIYAKKYIGVFDTPEKAGEALTVKQFTG